MRLKKRRTIDSDLQNYKERGPREHVEKTNTAGLDPSGRLAVRKCCRGIIRVGTVP